MTTTPPAITGLPEAPDPNDRSTFNALAYPWSAALPTFGTQVSAVGANVKANADEAEADAIATAADRVQTGLDKISTAADRVQTGADRTAAANSSSTASTQAALATSNGAAQVTIATTQAGIATTKAGEANASAIAAAASVASIASGPVASVNGMTGVVTNIATTGANTFTGAQNLPTGAAIVSAATVNLDTATGNRVHITGTTAITAVTLTRGPRTVIFDGILTLTHHATNNKLPGGANITTAAGDVAIYEGDGTTVRCINYTKVSGAPIVAPIVATSTTSGLVPIPPNNTTTFLRGDATFAPLPASASGLTLLSTVTAVAAATVDIETGFSGTYDNYLIVGSDIYGSGVGFVLGRLKIGGVYLTAGYDAASITNTASGGSVGVVNSTNLSAVSRLFLVDVDANCRAGITMRIFAANSSARKAVEFDSSYTQATDSTRLMGSIGNRTAGVLSGVRMYGATGTITGTFRLYGIANS